MYQQHAPTLFWALKTGWNSDFFFFFLREVDCIWDVPCNDKRELFWGGFSVTFQGFEYLGAMLAIYLWNVCVKWQIQWIFAQTLVLLSVPQLNWEGMVTRYTFLYVLTCKVL